MAAETATPRRRKTAAKPLTEPVTKRHVVCSPKGRVFLICSGCQHWVRRLLVVKCPCCMSHTENPNVASVAAEMEN
jgi:hypothetical protein